VHNNSSAEISLPINVEVPQSWRKAANNAGIDYQEDTAVRPPILYGSLAKEKANRTSKTQLGLTNTQS